jgi:DNA-binding SARP family transcriptional activator
MTRSAMTMRLLGGFELRRGDETIEVPLAAHRVLGFLALNDRRLPRSYVADALWPDTNEERASANLRTALWRLRRLGCELLVVSAASIGLDPSLWVDARLLHGAAREYRRHSVLPDPEQLLEWRGELLPECWDSWVVYDRERLRQEAVQLFEASSLAALLRGDSHLAFLLALGAVECDPLRRSANMLAIRARLAIGDRSGAVRHARGYARLLDDGLGTDPLDLVVELLAPDDSAELAAAVRTRAS